MSEERIKITLCCFSVVRQHFGKSRVELDLPPGSTTADLEAEVRERLGPTWGALVFRMAVNREFIDKTRPLRSGDEIALIPPMQGG
jgi:molybdopterin converting factor small subunit